MNLIYIVIIFVSITFHEYCHAWVANKLGDPTPAKLGRLSLNPLKHFDLFGTLILPILLIFITRSLISFGYAKPVQINHYHFKNFRRDMLWVALAGPLGNLLIALAFSVIFWFVPPAFSQLMVAGVIINLFLALGNLIPIPPFDGSKIVSSLLPYRFSYWYGRMELLSVLVLFVLIWLGALKYCAQPIISFVLAFL